MSYKNFQCCTCLTLVLEVKFQTVCWFGRDLQSSRFKREEHIKIGMEWARRGKPLYLWQEAVNWLWQRQLSGQKVCMSFARVLISCEQASSESCLVNREGWCVHDGKSIGQQWRQGTGCYCRPRQSQSLDLVAFPGHSCPFNQIWTLHFSICCVSAWRAS